MRTKDWFINAVAALNGSGNPDARHDARSMLCDALDTRLDRLFLKSDLELSRAQLSLLDKRLGLRISGKPLQYIHGKAYFMGYEYIVDERCLIPRQDTELLCELAVERIGNERKTVFDACTGSGAVAIAIALKCPNARVYASDLSEDALDVARENARRLGADVVFAKGDFLNAFDERFNMVTCNPPYLNDEDMLSLQKEVSFEPRMALYGGEDGLDFYNRAFREINPRLKNDGVALFEVGMGQAEALTSLGFSIMTYKDLNGIDRVIEFGGF